MTDGSRAGAEVVYTVRAMHTNVAVATRPGLRARLVRTVNGAALAGVLVAAAAACGATEAYRPPRSIDVRFAVAHDEPENEQEMAFLARAVQILTDDPALHALVVGHADPEGTLEHNQALSLRRARRTRTLLLERGIAPERVTVAALGEREPLVAGTSAESRAADRRAEIYLYDPRRGTAQVQYRTRLVIHPE